MLALNSNISTHHNYMDTLLVFEPSETEKTVFVEPLGDKLRENSEFFLVNLSSPVNAVYNGDGALGGIFNDDQAVVTITARQDTVSEGSVIVFDLERDGHPFSPLTATIGRTIDA